MSVTLPAWKQIKERDVDKPELVKSVKASG